MFSHGPILATGLILIPAIGALGVFVFPESSKSGRFDLGVASMALLVALVEIALWVLAVHRFDFKSPEAVQLDQHHVWLKDLGVSYDVGFTALGLWLVGLTVVVMAAAIAYAYWNGRERTNAYYGLMLLLLGAI